MTAPAIPLAKPWIGEREAEAARRVLLSGWVTQGPEVAGLESEFAAFVGAPHACAVSSGTTALHLALVALGVGAGDEVVTVSHSFIATANVVRHCGATPVFVDIEPATYNIDPSLVDEVIGPRTRAILCVHQLGMPCNLDALTEIANRRGVPLVEDAACAVGSEVRSAGGWERIGRPRGRIACFSFHPRKLLTTGDGGMITTADSDLDRQARLLRQHGMTLSDRARHVASAVAVESYAIVGYNYRLTDIQAAIGRVQLARLPEAIARRRDLAARYTASLADVPGLATPAEPAWARSNFQTYSVRLPAGCDQRAVMQQLLDEGIATRRGVMCAHREPAYADAPWSCTPSTLRCPCGPGGCRRLRASEEAQDRSIQLPLYHDLADDDQRRVMSVLRAACVRAGASV